MLRRPLPDIYEGWLVVGASAFILTIIGASFFLRLGPLFHPWLDAFGWTVAATPLALSLRPDTAGVAAPPGATP